MWKELITGILYPARCPICDGADVAGQSGCCRRCADRLTVITGAVCMRCGKPLEEGEFTREYCHDCQEKQVSYEYGRSVFLYDRYLQDSIARFKYYGRREYAAYYGEEMYRTYGDWLRSLESDVLIPVPIHANRMRKRGYNQAALVARNLSDRTGIPVEEKLLIRQRDTLPQKELNSQERLSNLLQAFAICEKGQVLNQIPECVILIDDIYTTGSTMEACAKTLKKAGVQRVYFLCICVGKGY